MGFKNDSIQVQEYTYDFAVDGGATGVYTLSSKANVAALPEDAIITKVVTRVVTAFAGSGASAIIGNTASSNAFMAIQAVASLSEDAVFSDTDVVVANAADKQDVIMTVSGGALTAGKLKVLVEYMQHE